MGYLREGDIAAINENHPFSSYRSVQLRCIIRGYDCRSGGLLYASSSRWWFPKIDLSSVKLFKTVFYK